MSRVEEIVPATGSLPEAAEVRTAAFPGLVATAFPGATEAAAEILQNGGNAVDAAVAAAWALAVGEPSGSGLGGKTVALIRFADGHGLVLDGRSPAPAAVSRKNVSRARQPSGYRSVTIPSTVAVLGTAQQRFGRLPRAKVMEPAIRLAEEGYAVTPLYCRQLKWCRLALRASPATRRMFLNQGLLLKPGEVFRQPALAGTLRRLAETGPEDFYAGQIARDLVDDMVQNDGLITLEDLAEGSRPMEVEPITTTYRGQAVLSVPPPGGGLTVMQALKILEQFPASELGRDTEGWYETMARVLYAVLREQERWPITPDQLTPSLGRWLLSEERARELAARLDCLPGEWPDDAGEEEPGETTHLCTADRHGNVVSLSQSLQSLFGAKVAHPKLGFLYNNALRTCPRHAHAYQLAGRCLPRSNLAPTLIELHSSSPPTPDRSPDAPETSTVLALGAAGSRRIISSIVQVISSFLDARMPLREAVSRPRIHVMLSGKVHIESGVATPALQRRLARRYRELRLRAPHSYFMGAVQAVQTGPEAAAQAAADPRRDGTARKVDP